MKTIKLGTENDAVTYAVKLEEWPGELTLYPCEESEATHRILSDSGCLPGVTDVDGYICHRAEQALGYRD